MREIFRLRSGLNKFFWRCKYALKGQRQVTLHISPKPEHNQNDYHNANRNSKTTKKKKKHFKNSPVAFTPLTKALLHGVDDDRVCRVVILCSYRYDRMDDFGLIRISALQLAQELLHLRSVSRAASGSLSLRENSLHDSALILMNWRKIGWLLD